MGIGRGFVVCKFLELVEGSVFIIWVNIVIIGIRYFMIFILTWVIGK